MRFAALNKEPSASSARPQASGKRPRPMKEAQESGFLQRYHEAMRLQQEGQVDEARALYQEILGSKVMDEADLSSSMLLRLKFLIYKNLGSIARSHGDQSAAVDAYIQAVGVDGSDVTVWYQLAQASCNLGNLLLGRTALEEALKCHAHYWPAVDLLCSVLYALRDTSACLQAIGTALDQRPDFPRGLAYLHQLATSSPDLLTFRPSLRLHLMKPRPPDAEQLIGEAIALGRRRSLLAQVSAVEELIRPPRTLAYYSLYSLGKGLISIYHHCKELSHKAPSLATPVDLQLLSEGTSDRPLLPSPAKRASTPAALSSELGDGASTCSSGEEGGEGGKRELKRRAPDVYCSLLPKRRSTRVKTKREQISISERFAKYLPDSLSGCEFGEVAVLSPLWKPRETVPTPAATDHCSDQSDSTFIDSTPCLVDADVVKSFLQEHRGNSGIINLMFSYLLLLAQHYDWRWAEATFPVARMFQELFELTHPHLVYPPPLCSPEDVEYSSLQDLAMICLCYSELKVEGLQRAAGTGHPASPLPGPLAHAISFSQLACGGEGGGWKGRTEFSLRVHWCLSKLKEMRRNLPGALNNLEKCSCLLQGWVEGGDGRSLVVCIGNLREAPFISPDHVHKKMKSLCQVVSSDQVYSLNLSGDHSGVVERLRPMLECESDTNSQFLLGGDHGDGRCPALSLLLTSLLCLDRVQECMESCVRALTELLLHYKLGNERWISALRDTYSHLDRCLEAEPDVLDRCEEKVRRHLVVCIFKTLDLHVEMADSHLLLLMPLCLPWKILYTALQSVWAASKEVVMETRDVVTMETSAENVDVVMATEGTAGAHALTAAMATSKDISKEDAPVTMSNEESGSEGQATDVAMTTTSRLLGAGVGLEFLREVHGYLGGAGQGWCVQDEGCLLKTMVGELRRELQILTAHSHKTRETLLRDLEQCYYCLYGHPHKKAKAWGLQDHGAEQLPLTWESAQVLLEFYHPSFLPAVEENKTLTPELVSLYRRLVDVIPDTGKVLPLEVIAGYIEGRMETLPLPSPPAPHTALVSEIFYLLADDSLKSGEFFAALHNYTQSVCYCSERVDTWAGLALARARSIMKKLDRRDVRGGVEALLQKQVTPTLRCFKRALALGSQHRYITEKYGLFCYTVQSYCSQIMAQPQLHSQADVWARRTCRGLLQLAYQCFTSALSEVGVAGVWPWYYGLIAGKAGMKLGQPASVSLPLLMKAAEMVRADEPIPPHTVELRGQHMTAVEVHYQIHSCALKYLMKQKVGGAKEQGEMVAIAEVVSRCEALPLGGTEGEEVKLWVSRVLGGQETGTKEKVGGEEYGAGSGTSVSEAVGLAHSNGADAVSLLVQRVIADAEREVAMETVARGEAEEEAMETDNVFHSVTSSALPSETTCSESTQPGSGSGMPHIATSLPQIVVGSAQPNSTEAVSAAALGEQGGMAASRLFSVSSFGSIGSISSETSSEPPPSPPSPEDLLERCLWGVAVCAVRCPAYYKPLYRLATTLHGLGHSQAARQLLLGPLPEVLLRAQDKLQPLFVLRANVFANFWQIPVEEINRPGSFSSHARSSVQLLCEVLSQQQDSASLLLLAQHLRSRPDSTRQYLRDYERVAMCQKTIQHCTSVQEKLISAAADLREEKLHSLLLEVFSLRSLAQRTDTKHLSLAQAVEGNLVQCYQLCQTGSQQFTAAEPVATQPATATASSLHCSLLDEAVKYCQARLGRARTDK